MHPDLISLLNAAVEDAPDVAASRPENSDESEDDLVDEYIDKLRFFFDDNLLLAALDLIDRDSVIKFLVPWGHVQYQVLGASATYTVFPGNYSKTVHTIPPYCTCASFAFSALISDSQYMCKHILAVTIAERMSRCIERPVSADDLAEISVQQGGREEQSVHGACCE
ncbi:hypothetical protein NM688_g8082 [Phlebia brevispora]|uniref:Uncharacterized protein n=1 Tax=Phlebia brevispora TaxID=194682 RepID=A0ACC1RY13_9APHY|nr:hypothetical protein NM688_g8082 [Phlebia brevispora]